MDTASSLWVGIVLNGLLIALVLTFPVLVGFMFISLVRKSTKKERDAFESKVISLLEEIRDAQKAAPRRDS